MSTANDLTIARGKANAWLNGPVDSDTRARIEEILRNDNDLLEAFGGDLEFGTGGLRGVMGTGTTRINRYTIGMATQGLANYIRSQFEGQAKAVAIAYDSRHNSRELAFTAADVLSANGITVHIFPELRPTPLLSFAVRHLHCQSGIVVTASHNPPEYNGYKVYWNDGAQVLTPHDEGIIREVRNIASLDAIQFAPASAPIHIVGPELEEQYLRLLLNQILSREEILKESALPVVYTSIHGAGITMVPKALAAAGFTRVSVVEEQAVPDGQFPTVKSPNPEEKDAMKMALDLAEKLNADLVLGTDPDTDRVGVGVRNDEGQLVLLNGNQTGSLIVWYELNRRKERGMLPANAFVAKTIVTTELIAEIGRKAGVTVVDTLTGFKYMAEEIRLREGTEQFICGGEESYGYMIGDFVRDKDGVISAVVVAEMAAWARNQGITLWQLLMRIYAEYGLFVDELVSITIKGMDGVQKIREMMEALRKNPPSTLGGSRVVRVHDYLKREVLTMPGQNFERSIAMPVSNVLQFELEDGSRITARPSGTEPKIKFYFSLKGTSLEMGHYQQECDAMKVRVMEIRRELGV